MTQTNPLVHEDRVVPAAVEAMADQLERYFIDGDDRPLRALVGVERPDPLQPALERWILEQIDLEDAEIAGAVLSVIAQRIERRTGIGGH